MSAPWQVLLRPSPAGAAILGAAHAAAAAAAYVALPTAAATLCIAGVALSLAATSARLLHRSRRSVLGLELHADGSAAWLDVDGRWHRVDRLAGVALAPWLIVVALQDAEGRRRGLLIVPDAADPAAVRRLRVWLRWRPPTSAARTLAEITEGAKNPCAN